MPEYGKARDDRKKCQVHRQPRQPGFDLVVQHVEVVESVIQTTLYVLHTNYGLRLYPHMSLNFLYTF
jgi:hypothetical protein